MAEAFSEQEDLDQLKEKFMCACIDGEMDVIDSMLDDGFDVNFHHDFWETTPLHQACCATGPWVIDVVTKLIEHGADVELVNKNDEAALDKLLSKAPFQEHVAQLLLDCSKLGVNRLFVNDTNYLCFANSVETLKFLVKNGIDINNVYYHEDQSFTKLDELYEREDKQCIDYLVSIGGKRYSEL